MKDATIALHYAYKKDSEKSMQVPIYMTTAYEYDSTLDAAMLFNLEKEGNIYTRISNPTTDIFENRMAKLENGISALAVASGMASIFYSIANLVKSGDNILISKHLYGGSITLATQTLKQFNIEVRKFDVRENFEHLIDKNTKAILFESIANPSLIVADFDNIISQANRHNVVTICDNTIATNYSVKPIDLGVDIVVHSSSKYIVGNGSAIGGVIIESKSFKNKLNSNRYEQFIQEDQSYHGIRFSEFDDPFIKRARLVLLRDYGAVLSPFNSWLFLNGLETLHLRIKEHSKNALMIAEFLKSKGFSVNYPFLKGDINFNLANKYLKYGSGIVSFDVGDFSLAEKIANSTKIFKLVTNIGDSKSIITHPASTTHRQLNANELKEAGITEGLIRLSVGIEDIEDLIRDLESAIFN